MKVALDARAAAAAYAQAFQRFKELPGFDHAAILRAEAGSILKRWAGRTKVADTAESVRRARSVAAGVAGVRRAGDTTYALTANTGRRGGEPGRLWFRYPSGRFGVAGYISDEGDLRYSWIHYKKEHWDEIQDRATAYQTALRRFVPLAPRSVGLARQSVVQIADDLGIDLATVAGTGLSAAGLAKARAAIASNGRTYKNGTGLQAGDGIRYHITLINRLPYGVKSGMDRVLASVISGRAKYIARSYAKGAFDSLAGVARAFPNFKLTAAPAAPLPPD